MREARQQAGQQQLAGVGLADLGAVRQQERAPADVVALLEVQGGEGGQRAQVLERARGQLRGAVDLQLLQVLQAGEGRDGLVLEQLAVGDAQAGEVLQGAEAGEALRRRVGQLLRHGERAQPRRQLEDVLQLLAPGVLVAGRAGGADLLRAAAAQGGADCAAGAARARHVRLAEPARDLLRGSGGWVGGWSAGLGGWRGGPRRWPGVPAWAGRPRWRWQ
jgi:hypothetical protein